MLAWFWNESPVTVFQGIIAFRIYYFATSDALLRIWISKQPLARFDSDPPNQNTIWMFYATSIISVPFIFASSFLNVACLRTWHVYILSHIAADIMALNGVLDSCLLNYRKGIPRLLWFLCTLHKVAVAVILKFQSKAMPTHTSRCNFRFLQW